MINVHFKLVQYFYIKKYQYWKFPPSEDNYKKSKKMVLG